MTKILRLLTLFCVLIFTSNAAYSVGYTCDGIKQYTSCNAGRYLEKNGSYSTAVGNACTTCPANYYCTGNTANKVACKVQFNTSISNGTRTCYHTTSVAGSDASSDCTGTANCSCSCNSGYHVSGSGSTCTCVKDAVTCNKGYYLPANKSSASDCKICDAEYYCPGGDFTPNSSYIQGRNSCPSYSSLTGSTIKQTWSQYNNAKPTSVNSANSTGFGVINDCRILYWLKADGYGTGYTYASYNTSTGQYSDPIWNGYRWASVEAGKYLTTTTKDGVAAGCGAYAYYWDIKTCDAGYYCPGKSEVACNSSNESTVHTATFGREVCPAGKYCPAGASSPTNCAAGTYRSGTGGTASSSCTVCSTNQYSNAGATSCTACNSAYANSGTAASNHAYQSSCKKTITLSKNGGSGTIQGVAGTTSASITCSQGNSCSFGSASGLTQTGYTFKGGWGTSLSCTATTTSFVTPTISTYYACKSGNQYTVTLSANGGTAGSTTSVTATYGSSMPTIATTALPRRAGYTFAGYYDATSGGTQYYTSTGASARAWNKTSSATLYAHWTACGSGYYCSGAAYNSKAACSSIASGLFPNTNTTTATSMSYCLTDTLAAGTYINVASSSSATKYTTCTSGYICPGGVYHYKTGVVGRGYCAKGAYASNNKCVLCHAGQTTSSPYATSCVTCQSQYGDAQGTVGIGSWATPKWSTSTTTGYTTSSNSTYGGITSISSVNVTNKCEISTCTAGYYLTPHSDDVYGCMEGNFTENDIAEMSEFYQLCYDDSFDATSAYWINTCSPCVAGTYKSGTNATQYCSLCSLGQTSGSAASSCSACSNNAHVSSWSNTTPNYSTSYQWNKLLTGVGAISNKCTISACATGYQRGGTANATAATSYNCNTPIVYTITLNHNGGTGTSPIYEKYGVGYSLTNFGTTITSVTKPTKSGVTVTFNANSGSVSPASRSTSYTFNGYYTATSGGTQRINNAGTILASNTTFTSDTTIYAQWTCNGVTLPTPTRTGYTFNGWYTAASGGTKITSSYCPSSATTLYAQWTACTACSAGTGANCSMSVVNNACTYTTSCKDGYYAINNNGKYNPSCSACGDGYYCKSAVRTACPTADTGWTVSTDTSTSSSWSSCYEEMNFSGGIDASKPNDWCDNADLIRPAISASAYGDIDADRSSITTFEGSYIDKSNSKLWACRMCADGTYSAGGSATSCNSCSALTPAVAVTGGTYSSVSPRSTSSNCRYKAPSPTVPTYCATKTSNTISYSGTAWGTNIYSVTAKAGSIISGNNTKDATCSQCGAGTVSAGGTATSCSTCDAGTYTSAAGQSSCAACPAGKYCTGGSNVTNCSAGTYRSSTGGKAASDCSACSALTGVSPTGGTYTSAAGSTSNTACKYTAPSKTITGCATVTPAQVTYSGTAWPATTYTVTASGGYVIANNGKTNATCSACGDGTYSAGGSATSCSACSALTGVSVSGGTYTSVSPRNANTTCRYKAPNKTITGCSSVTTNTMSYSGTAWPATTYNVSASGGYVIANNGTANATCTQCSGAVFSAGGSATSCTSCPAQTDGWTRNTGTGWSTVTQCNQTKSVGGNCTEGTLRQNATSTSAWGSSVVHSALKAKAGSYVNGQTCTACSAGYYQGTNGSTVTSCTAASKGYNVPSAGSSSQTACGAGKYQDATGQSSCKSCPTLTSGYAYTSTTGLDAVTKCTETKAASSVSSNCYGGQLTKTAKDASTWNTATSTLTAKAGSYLSGSSDNTTCIQCVLGSTSTGGSATSCTACQSGKTTSAAGQSSCNAACSNATNVGAWKTATWNTNNTMTNLCTIDNTSTSACTAAVKGTGAASASWTVSSNKCVYSGTCSAKYYNPTASGATISCAGCPTAYPNSASGNAYTSDAYCYLTLTAGKQVASAGAGASACAAGRYCTSTANIFKGTAGGTTTYTGTACQTGSYQDATGQTVCKACAAGKTNTGTGNTAACTTACSNNAGVNAWTTTTWSNGTVSNLCTVTNCSTNYYKNSNACSTCTSNNSKYTKSANANSTGLNACYLETTGGNYVATAGAGQVACPANSYCEGGTKVYVTTGVGATTGGITGCPSGYASPASASAKNQCTINCAAGSRVTTADATCTAITSGNVYMLAHTVKAGSASPAATSCPTNYTISGSTQADHDAKSDCKISCSAGYAVQTVDAACAIVTSGYQTGTHTVSAGSKTPTATDSTSPAVGTWYSCLTNYSATGTAATDHDARSDCKISCAAGTRIANVNATSCTTPSGNWYVGAHTVSAGGTSSVNSCLTNYTISGTAATNHDAASDCKISCNGGAYIAKANDTSCTNVGAGYWAGASTVSQGSAGSRTACASGLTTIGYGAGADEAADCGRILNVGSDKIYLRSTKKTTPSLNVKVGDTTYYGNMTSGALDGYLIIKDGNVTYRVHDDSK